MVTLESARPCIRGGGEQEMGRRERETEREREQRSDGRGEQATRTVQQMPHERNDPSSRSNEIHLSLFGLPSPHPLLLGTAPEWSDWQRRRAEKIPASFTGNGRHGHAGFLTFSREGASSPQASCPGPPLLSGPLLLPLYPSWDLAGGAGKRWSCPLLDADGKHHPGR
jgi:hypothetical protein